MLNRITLVATGAVFALGSLAVGSDTAAASCNSAGLVSQASNEARELVVVNAVGDRAAELYWVDFSGAWVHYATIPPNGRHVQQTYRGHVWLSVNSYNYCDIVFTVENNVEIIIK
jgi:hypothetical protein